MTGGSSDEPAPFDIDAVTQQMISITSRRNSLASHHPVGNILDLFKRDEEEDDLESHDFYDHISYTEQTPLKATHDLRNPLSSTYSNNLLNDDLISSYSGRRNSLATLRKMKSHNTINYVISHGALPEIETSTKHEMKILTKYSIPLIITFILQYSLNVASVFSVGRIGKTELAAVSLAAMTANITGYCIFQGTATALDTLCPQAFGRKDYNSVGLHFLRCTIFLFLLFIPVSITWIFLSKPILSVLVDDQPLVIFASDYLRILSFGLPGYILFESLKKFLQAQNIFHASTYVILVAAPFNVFLNYYLVWSKAFGLGFTGAPISIVITNYLMGILLLIYTIFIDGYQCWCGFNNKLLFSNWSKMISLAINGCLGVICEWLAFEILTLSAARFGTAVLASQSVISTICILSYQLPFATSIATSTRIANYIGSGSKAAALKATKGSILLSLFIGVINCFILTNFKFSIIKLFTNEIDVIEEASKILPIVALYQINDALASIGSGILRGQGKQRLVALVSIVTYYTVALPFGFLLGFYFNLELSGLWYGFVIGVIIISFLQLFYILKTNWEKTIDESLKEAMNESHLQSDLVSVISHGIHDQS